jgi:arabinose-5-phosphate isomerase
MLTGNKIPFVKENLNMKSAIKILSNKKLGVLIVQNKQNKTIGIITEVKLEDTMKRKQNLNEMKCFKNNDEKAQLAIERTSFSCKGISANE